MDAARRATPLLYRQVAVMCEESFVQRRGIGPTYTLQYTGYRIAHVVELNP